MWIAHGTCVPKSYFGYFGYLGIVPEVKGGSSESPKSAASHQNPQSERRVSRVPGVRGGSAGSPESEAGQQGPRGQRRVSRVPGVRGGSAGSPGSEAGQQSPRGQQPQLAGVAVFPAACPLSIGLPSGGQSIWLLSPAAAANTGTAPAGQTAALKAGPDDGRCAAGCDKRQ